MKGGSVYLMLENPRLGKSAIEVQQIGGDRNSMPHLRLKLGLRKSSLRHSLIRRVSSGGLFGLPLI